MKNVELVNEYTGLSGYGIAEEMMKEGAEQTERELTGKVEQLELEKNLLIEQVKEKNAEIKALDTVRTDTINKLNKEIEYLQSMIGSLEHDFDKDHASMLSFKERAEKAEKVITDLIHDLEGDLIESLDSMNIYTGNTFIRSAHSFRDTHTILERLLPKTEYDRNYLNAMNTVYYRYYDAYNAKEGKKRGMK